MKNRPLAVPSLPPFRRRVLFEALEARVLLSADAVGALDATGQLDVALDDAGRDVTIRHLGDSARGGAKVRVEMGASFWDYGDDSAGVQRIVVTGGAGDDRFDVAGAGVAVVVDGKGGTDSLTGPAADSRWLITGADSGSVGQVSFLDVERLLGAAGNRDTFVLLPGGSVSGVADGGEGGFDSLEIEGGAVAQARFLADGPHDGSVILDGVALRYAGLEPITLTGTSAVTVEGTVGADDLILEADPTDATKLRVRSLTGTLESVSFARTASSVTIKMGLGDDKLEIGSLGAGILSSLTVDGELGSDSITVSGDVTLPGKNFDVTAETLLVTGSISVRTTAPGANQETAASTGASGNIALRGETTNVSAGKLFAQDTLGNQSVSLTPGTIAGKWLANEVATTTQAGTWAADRRHRLQVQSATSGGGDGLVADLTVDSAGKVKVDVVDFGDDYLAGDTVTFKQPDKDADGNTLTGTGTVTITLSALHRNLAQASTSGKGEGMTIDVAVGAGGVVTWTRADPGAGYAVGDSVTFHDPLEFVGPLSSAANTISTAVTAWAGNVLVEGRDQFGSFGTSLLFVEVLTAKPAVDINGATIVGENVTVRAIADTVNEADGDDTTQQVVDELFLDDLKDLNLQAGVSVVDATAKVQIAADVETRPLVATTGTWTTGSTHRRVSASGTTGSGSGMLADIEVTSGGGVIVTVVNPGTGYAAGDQVTFTEPDVDADGDALTTDGTVTVTLSRWQQTIVRADGDVSLHADAKAKASLNTIGAAFAASVSVGMLESVVSVAGGANITTGGTLRLGAAGDNTTAVSASVISIKNGATVVVGATYGKSRVDAFIDNGANISAGNVAVDAKAKNEVSTEVAPLEYASPESSGAAIGISVLDSVTNAWIDSTLTVDGDVSVQADTDTANTNAAAAEPASTTGGLLQGGFQWAKKLLGKETPKKESGVEKLEISAAIVFTWSDNDVNAYLGKNAVIRSHGDVDVGASVKDDLRISATSTAENAETALSASIAIARTQDQANAYIADGASVDASGALRVRSLTVIPSPLPDNAWGVFAPDAETGAGAIISILKSTTNVEGLIVPLLTSYTRSGAKAESKSDENATNPPKSSLSLAGSFNFLHYDNGSRAWIGSSAKINQTESYRADGQTVDVDAQSKAETINVVGIFSFPNPADALVGDDPAKQRIIDAMNPIGSSGDKAFGGSYSEVNYLTKTFAEIREGAIVHARNGTSVRAKSDHWTFNLSVAGGVAEKMGVEGAVGVVFQDSETVAQVHDGANVTGGGLEVLATDDTSHLAVTGGAVWSKNVGVGFSIAVERVVRKVEAVLGERDALATAKSSTIDVTGDVLVDAISTGKIQSYSVAGSLKTAGDSGQNKSDAPVDLPALDDDENSPVTSDTDTSESASKKSKFGFSVAGDISVNVIDDTARAVVNHLGTVSAGTGSTVGVQATNSTDLVAVAGAASFAMGSKTVQSKSVGIAGSVGVNVITGITQASVTDADVLQAGRVDIDARRTGDVLSVTAGGSGVARQSGIAIAGAVAYNQLTDTTTAFLVRSGVTSGGAISVEATNGVTVLAIAGAAAFTIAAGGQSAGSAGSVGIAIGVNKVTATVDAYTDGSVLVAGGGVTIHAESSIDLDAYAFGGALSASSGTGGSGTALIWGGAGGASGNVVTNTVTARSTGGSITTSSSGAVSITATDRSTVTADAGGFALTFRISSSNQNSGAVSVGVSASVNKVTNTAIADIDGTTVNADGAVTVRTRSLSVIEALAIAGTLTGVSTSGSGLAGSGAGAGTGNTITNTGRARVRNGANVTAKGAVTVETTDSSAAGEKSHIKADSGGVAIALQRGAEGKTDVNLTFGISVAVNTVTNTLEATVDNATVSAGGAVSVRAVSEVDIDALTIAGALSGGTGSGESSFLFNLGGAGAGSGNSVTNTVSATVAHGATVTTTGNAAGVTVSATDDSGIVADAGAVALALGYSSGSTNINLSFGASAAVNEVGNTVEASVSGASTVTATGAVTVGATSTATIDALTVAGAGSGGLTSGKSGTGFAIAGAGTGSDNEITNSTLAYVSGASTVTSGDGHAVSINATDTSTITNMAIAGSLALNFGGSAGGTVTVSVSIAYNDIANTTRAYIDGSTVTAGGDLTVKAKSSSTIETLSTGAAVSGTVTTEGSLAIAGTGAGATSTNKIKNITEAYIAGALPVATGSGKALSVLAEDSNRIEGEATGGSLGFAVSSKGAAIAAAIGVSIAENTVENRVRAYLSGTTTVTAGTVTIQATETPAKAGENMVDALAVSVGVAVALTNPKEGISIALTGAGAQADNTIRNTVAAFVDGDAKVNATGAVSITARETATMDAKVPAIGVSVGILAVAVGISLSENTVESTVDAYIGDATIDTTGGGVDVTASATHTMDTVTAPIGASIGIGIGVAGSETIANIKGHVEAGLKSGAEVTASGAMRVMSYSTADADAESQGGGAGAVSLNVLSTDTEVSQDTRAYVGSGAKVTAGSLSVTTYGLGTGDPVETTRIATGNVVVGSVAVEGLSGSDVEATVSGDVEAYVSGTAVVTLTGTALVEAKSRTTADAKSSGGSGGIVNASALFVDAVAGGVTRAYVGPGSTLSSSSLTVKARGVNTATADELSVAIALAGGAGGATVATVTALTEAYVGGGFKLPTSDRTRITTGALIITAEGTNVAEATPRGGAGGGVAIGAFTAEATVGGVSSEGAVRAFVGEGVVIRASSLAVTATGTNTATVDLLAIGVGVLAGAGGKGDSAIHSDVEAFLSTGVVRDDETPLVITGDIDVTATSVDNATSKVSGGSGGGLSASVFFANANHDGSTRAFVDDDTHLVSGTLDVKAQATTRKTRAELVVGAVAVLGGGGGTSTATTGGAITAFLGEDSAVDSGTGAMTVQALSSGTRAEAVADGGAAGGIAISLFDGTATTSTETTARVDQGAVVRTGAFTLKADATDTALADIATFGIGIGAGGTADATADGKAVVGVSVGDADPAVNGSKAKIEASGGITILAKSTNTADADADSITGGGIAYGGIDATANAVQRNTVTIGRNAELISGGALSVTAQSKPKADANTDGGSGSLVDIAEADATGDIDDVTTVTLANGARLFAETSLTVEAKTDQRLVVMAETDSFGVAAAIPTSTAKGEVTTTVLLDVRGANLEAESTTLAARNVKLDADVTADADAGGTGANTDANATLTSTLTATTQLATGADVTGRGLLSIGAFHDALDTASGFIANSDALLGDTSGVATNALSSTTRVDADSGAILRTRNLVVKADADATPTFDATAARDGAVGDWGDSSTTPTVTQRRTIDFDATVFMLGAPNPILEIDSAGNASSRSNVGFQRVGSTINVDPIRNTGSGAGNISISILGTSYDTSSLATTSSIVRGAPSITWMTSFEKVILANASPFTLSIGDIEVTNPSADFSSNVSISARTTSGLTLNQTTGPGPTKIEITSTGAADVRFTGQIRNPLGSTTVESRGGSIDRTGNARIVSDSVSFLAAGAIGSTDRALRMETSRVTRAAAGTGVFLDDLTGDLQVAGVSSTTGNVRLVTVGSMTGGNAPGEVAISGVIVTLEATTGAIGSAADAIEIDAGQAVGSLNAQAATGAHLTDVRGGVGIGLLDVLAGDVTLTLPDSVALNEMLAMGAVSTIRSRSGRVALSAGDAITMAAGSVVSSSLGTAVRVDNDLGRPADPDGGAGAVLSIAGRFEGAAVDILLGSDSDRVALQGTAVGAAVSVDGGEGDDSVFLGSAATPDTNTGGRLSTFLASVTVHGRSGEDRVLLDATGVSDALAGTVDVTQVTGFGLADGVAVSYDGVDSLEVALGQGTDSVTVAGTADGTTTLLRGGAGLDVFQVGDAQGRVNALGGLLVIAGEGDGGTLSVNDSGDAAANSGELNGERLLGLGMGSADQTARNADRGIAFSGIASLSVALGDGADSFQVKGVSVDTTILGGGGDDDFTVGEDADGSSLAALGAPLHLRGGIGANQMLITAGAATALTLGRNAEGLGTVAVSGAAGSVDFAAFDEVVVALDDGNDSVTVTDTVGRTSLFLGQGDDQVEIAGASNLLDIVLAGGDDLATIRTASSMVSVDGGTGDRDRLVVDVSARSGAVTGQIGAGASSGVVSGLTGDDIVFDRFDSVAALLGSGNDAMIVDTELVATSVTIAGGAGDDAFTVRRIGKLPTTLSGGAGEDTVTVEIDGAPVKDSFLSLQLDVEELVVDNRDNAAVTVPWRLVDGAQLRVAAVAGNPEFGVIATEGAQRVRILGGDADDSLAIVSEAPGDAVGAIDDHAVSLSLGRVVLEPARSSTLSNYDTVIGFDSLTPSLSHSEDGFVITTGAGATRDDSVSAALVAADTGSTFVLTRNAGQPFALFSMMLAAPGTSGSQVVVRGTNVAGDTFSVTLDASGHAAGTPLVFSRHTFLPDDGRWTALTRVEIDARGVAVDNIALAPLGDGGAGDVTAPATPTVPVYTLRNFSSSGPDVVFDTDTGRMTVGTITVDTNGDGIADRAVTAFSNDFEYLLAGINRAFNATVGQIQFAGDLVVENGAIVSATGSRALSLSVDNDVRIGTGATLTVSASGRAAGAGGGIGGGGGAGSTTGGLAGGGGAGGARFVNSTRLGGRGGDGGITDSGVFTATIQDGAGGSTGASGTFGSSGTAGGRGSVGGGGSAGVNGSLGGSAGGGGAGGSLGTRGTTGGGGGGGGGGGTARGWPSNGGRGGDGDPGTPGGAGNNGGSGFTGDAGKAGSINLDTNGQLAGGGGGGAGGGGGRGGGGGGGVGGGAGGGGGGGGSNVGFFGEENNGGNGGSGGAGGAGGSGQVGGNGGRGGDGGGGGGAFEIVARGTVRLEVNTQLQATGGNGSEGQTGASATGDRGPGAGRGNGAGGGGGGSGGGSSAGGGGTGGNGAAGGQGGLGGQGGTGGPGAGGAGGAVKLVGTVLDAGGARVDARGGAGATSGPLSDRKTADSGALGRLIVGSNVANGPNAVAGEPQFGLNATKSLVAGPKAENPFIADGSNATADDTPFIAGLAGGAEVFGLLKNVTAASLAALFPDAPGDAVAGLIRLDVGPAGYAQNYTGYDMVLFVNLSPSGLAQPRLQMTLPGTQMAQTLPVLRIDGVGSATALGTLGVGAVWATLVPDVDGVQLSASVGGDVVPLSLASLPKAQVVNGAASAGQALYLRYGAPTPPTAQLGGADAIVLSPDAKQIYAVNAAAGTLSVLNAGDLTQRQLFKNGFDDITGLAGASDVTVSADGSAVLVVSGAGRTLLLFTRDAANGNLTFAGSTGFGVDMGNAPTIARGSGPVLAYVGGDAGIVAIRGDGTAGPPAFLAVGEVDRLELSADGRTLYASGGASGRLLVIDTAAWEVRQNLSGDHLAGATGATVSADGEFVFVAAQDADAVAVYRRAGNGTLALVQVLRNGIDGVRGLGGATDVTVSPDGEQLFVTGTESNAIAAFARDRKTGRLAFVQLLRNGVGSVEGVVNPQELVATPDGRELFVAAAGTQGTAGGIAALRNLALVGNELRSRPSLDTSRGDIFVLPDAFDVAEGTIGVWSVFADNAEALGRRVTPLLLESVNGGTGWRVVGIGTARSIAATGLQSFDFGLVEGSDSTAGRHFGWKQGDFAGRDDEGAVGFSFNGQARVLWLGNDQSDVQAGDVLAHRGTLPRAYSIQAGMVPRALSQTVRFSSVEALALETGAGNDVVTLRGALNTDVATTRIVTGDGGDRIVVQTAFGTTTILSQDGADDIQLLAGEDDLVLDVAAGRGADNVRIALGGERGRTTVAGEAGDDTVAVLLSALRASSTLDVQGDAAVDRLRVDPQGMTVSPSTFSMTDGTLVARALAADGTETTTGTLVYGTFETVEVLSAPAIALPNPVRTREGQGVTLTATITPRGTGNALRDLPTWDLDGDGRFGDATGETVQLSWSQLVDLGLGDDGTYLVSVQATNADGDTAQESTSLVIGNVAPTVRLTGAPVVAMGAPYTLEFSATDPGNDRVDQWSVNWGDGKVEVFGSGTASAQHVYTAPGNRTIVVTARDEDTTGQSSLDIGVELLSSAISAGGPYVIAEGGSVTLVADLPGTPSVVYWDIHLDLLVDAAGPVATLTWNDLQALVPSVQDSGVYLVQVYAEYDAGDGTTIATISAPTTLTVTNVAPTATFRSAGEVDEGAVARVVFENAFDPSRADTNAGYVYSVDIGDDGIVDVVSTTPEVVIPASLLRDSGSYLVRGRIADKDGGFTDYRTTVTVREVAPTLNVGGTGAAFEGDVYTLRLSARDPGRDTISQWLVDWNDGTVESFAGNVGSVSHRFTDDGRRTLTVTAVDEDGSTSTTHDVLVANVAPSLTAPAALQVAENGFVRWTGTISDPGTGDRFIATLDWGDGTREDIALLAGTTSFEATHRYLDDTTPGTASDGFVVTASVADDDGGASGTVSTDVAVVNVAPEVAELSLLGTAVAENGVATLIGRIHDAGTLDTHTVQVTWGDGQTSAAVVDAASRTFTATHRYVDDDPTGTGSDLYRIVASVTDKDGGTGEGSLEITVLNQAPVIEALESTETRVSASRAVYTLTGRYSDLGQADGHSVQVDWGDGAVSNATVDAATKTFTASHDFSDPGERREVIVTVIDDDGGEGSRTIVSRNGAANRPPVATADRFIVATDTPTLLDVLGNDSDPDADPITARVVTLPQHGSVSRSLDGRLLYTPDAGYEGPDAFTYRATDGASVSAIVTVSINDEVPNRAPRGEDRTVTMLEDGVHLFAIADFGFADPDDSIPDAFAGVLITRAPAAGALTLAGATVQVGDFVTAQDILDGRLVFTPLANANGSAYADFGFRVRDTGGTAQGGVDTDPVTRTLTLDVTAVNDAPVVSVIARHVVDEGQLLEFTVQASDVDGDGVTFGLRERAGGLPAGVLGLPSDATIDAQGRFRWRAADGDATQLFEVTASDGTVTVGEEIGVSVVNVAPTLTASGAATALAGQPYVLTLGVTDPGQDTLQTWAIDWGDGSALQVVAGSAREVSHVYNVPDGTYRIQAGAIDEDGAWSAPAIDVTVVSDLLRVQSFTATDGGFDVRFTRAFAASEINLYQTAIVPGRTPDVEVRDQNGALARGMLVLDADSKGLSFVATSGLLPAGEYQVTLASRSDGFVDELGRSLDGDANGVAGGDYRTSFRVDAGDKAVVSIANVTAGPKQLANVAATDRGIPITLTSARAVTEVEFTLRYDPTKLSVAGIEAGPDLPGGSTFSITGTAGEVVIRVTSPSPIAAGAKQILRLIAAVPETAAYRSFAQLDVSAASVDGAEARAADGVQVVAYLGDTTGDGAYSVLDSQRISRIVAGLDTGLNAYPTLDPVLIGDVDRDGVLTSADAAIVGKEVRYLFGGRTTPSLDQPEIPLVPTAQQVPTLATGGQALNGTIPPAPVTPVATPAATPATSASASLAFDLAATMRELNRLRVAVPAQDLAMSFLQGARTWETVVQRPAQDDWRITLPKLVQDVSLPGNIGTEGLGDGTVQALKYLLKKRR